LSLDTPLTGGTGIAAVSCVSKQRGLSLRIASIPSIAGILSSVTVALASVACTSDSTSSAGMPSSRRDGGLADASLSSPPRVKPPDAGSGLTPILHIDGGRTATNGQDGATICSAEVREAEQQKLDMLIAMDGSKSMRDEVAGGRKWDLVVDALTAFAEDPASAGIGVGLTYFGIPVGNDAGDPAVSCDIADYETPAVPIGDLPANGARLEASLSNYEPIGGTPTLPALKGVVEYAHTWLAAHSTHRVVIVLATDGEPNDCDSTVDAVSGVASMAAGERPPISTYVIGVGTSLSNLSQIATAGGTGHAYVVDTEAGTAASFTAAMNAIRGEAALPCNYELPAPTNGASLDYGRVNVARNSGADAGKTTLLQVPDAASCGSSDGWYYDDPAQPSSIELCPTTCAAVKHDATGAVQVLVGCKTETRVVR
jgi:hypothetical protein